MNQWDKLFQEKIKEVLHSQHRDYEYASLSPTASGNVARALIAEEYYAQADRIAELEKQLNLHKNAHHKCVEILQEKQSEPVAWMAEHFDGRKRVEIAGFVYDQDAGWGHKRIPLYTTPHHTSDVKQTKPLDEFIACKHGVDDGACKECYQEVTQTKDKE